MKRWVNRWVDYGVDYGVDLSVSQLTADDRTLNDLGQTIPGRSCESFLTAFTCIDIDASGGEAPDSTTAKPRNIPLPTQPSWTTFPIPPPSAAPHNTHRPPLTIVIPPTPSPIAPPMPHPISTPSPSAERVHRRAQHQERIVKMLKGYLEGERLTARVARLIEVLEVQLVEWRGEAGRLRRQRDMLMRAARARA